MTQSAHTSLVTRRINAPRHAVYEAFVDPDKLVIWRVPNSMTGKIHHFEARAGGEYRMSLTYIKPAESLGGKSTEDTDTFTGRFVQLIPDEKIVEVIEFESPDPRFVGHMTMTTTLRDVDGGTEISILAENIPPGVDPADNEQGTEESLAKLAALVER
ncbi:MAG TPA: SRPBCC family protein [Phototrophicaceae bacterium]|nr:SRPBCC family protein [Phototrophicaceae bacterium]